MEQTSNKRSLEDANQNTTGLTGRPTKQANTSTFFARTSDANAAADTHGAGRKCPNMKNRSREEIYYHCEWLSRLGMLTINNLVDALNEGDQRGAMDACFVGLPGVPDHGSEYDGGYFHTENRIRADIDKTRRMLKHSNLLVCRIRVNAPELPFEDKRLIMVHIKNRCDAVNAMSRRFAEHVTNTTVRSRLLSCHHYDHNIDHVAHDFLIWADTEYKSQFEALSLTVGENITKRLLRTNGIKSRLANGSVVRILDRLVGAPYSVKKLETFMCSGVAARFGDEEGLFRILDRLVGAPYSVKKLETFMCSGVAARFGDEEGLFRILDRLMGTPYSIKKLETFMCDGVAARFGDEEGLFRILDRLVGAPYSVKKLETFMCNGVAARFGDEEGLFRILDRLVGAPYSVKKLETFMCDGVAARFGDDAFLSALAAMPRLNKSRASLLCRSFPLAKSAHLR
jgi:hypothetical protein